MPISGFGSFCMGPLKGAVIKEFSDKVLYANPVFSVALPGPFQLLNS
jgi:hypothetical protein